MDKTHKIATFSLVFNLAFCAYNLGMSIFSKSWWLLTLGIYYLILSVVRFLVLRINRCKQSLTRVVGIMLLILSLPLAGTVILAVLKDRGQQLHEILMISMALYAFSKITLATITTQRGTLDQPNLKSKAAITNPKRKIKAENFTTPC